MSSTFTPGPWQQMRTDASVDDNASFCDDNSVQRIGTWCGIGNPDLTDPIVAIAVFDGAHDDPQFDANIKLIAKAPDMARLIADIEESFTADDSYPLLRDACRKLLREIGDDA